MHHKYLHTDATPPPPVFPYSIGFLPTRLPYQGLPLSRYVKWVRECGCFFDVLELFVSVLSYSFPIDSLTVSITGSLELGLSVYPQNQS